MIKSNFVTVCIFVHFIAKLFIFMLRLLSTLLVPKDALESLWTSYNLLGEGWGLSVNDLHAILVGASSLVAATGLTKADTERLFEAFDTDRNGLVDALELVVAVALLSGKRTTIALYCSQLLYG